MNYLIFRFIDFYDVVFAKFMWFSLKDQSLFIVDDIVEICIIKLFLTG